MRQRIKILARKNLKMSPGKLAAQAVHAALGLNDLGYTDANLLDAMMSVVVLEVSDAKFELARSLASEHQTYIVHDAGFTEVPAGAETVIAFLEDDPRGVYHDS